MGPEQGKAQQFYRYTDAEGRVHIITSPSSLPPGTRGKVEVMVLDAEATRAEHTVSHTPRETAIFKMMPESGSR
ncbi:MAG TPA: hypothetical protein VJN18_35230 [Polyangiaceae bacterium]|nr:hypothetical protein [Polyangiaceae bacterium]